MQPLVRPRPVVVNPSLRRPYKVFAFGKCSVYFNMRLDFKCESDTSAYYLYGFRRSVNLGSSTALPD